MIIIYKLVLDNKNNWFYRMVSDRKNKVRDGRIVNDCIFRLDGLSTNSLDNGLACSRRSRLILSFIGITPSN